MIPPRSLAQVQQVSTIKKAMTVKKALTVLCLLVEAILFVDTAWSQIEIKPVEDKTFIDISPAQMPGQVFRLRMPEYIQIWVDTAAEVHAKDVKWEKTSESAWSCRWEAPEGTRRKYLREFWGEVSATADTVDVSVHMKNTFDAEWPQNDRLLFCLQSAFADKFHDPEGFRTYVHRDGDFVNIRTFEGTGFKANAMGSAYPGPPKDSEKWVRRCDARLMAKVSLDGKYVLGIASDRGENASWNLDPITACIHQNLAWTLKPGQQEDFRCRIYILKGTLEVLWQRYRKDFAGNHNHSRVGEQPRNVASGGVARGDPAIQRYLAQESKRGDQGFMDGITSAEEWTKRREEWRREYFFMLGLWPMPEKTPLKSVITGTIEGDGYTVEMLHFQSRPGLYVTGNLYRPSKAHPNERLPAVLYVCGHVRQGRDGNKTAYQSHGIWFARHGYVCLVVDTLQLGEITSVHWGTYSQQRWWWHSRGYTPAGVECWNGIRAIDYLVNRPDVDPNRIAVTGISGGGAATFWIAAADERVAVAVPISGMADLESYVSHEVIRGHCDCMFLYNTFQWPWTQIAGLVAPRPLLFANSDNDDLFPMDANQRIINRLEELYSLFGASDRVDALVSRGMHAYREDIRQGAFRFINTYLKNDPRPVADSEVDLVDGERCPIPPERLRVFPSDDDVPIDQLNTRIDRSFVPMAELEPPPADQLDRVRTNILVQLRRTTFNALPERIPAARLMHSEGKVTWLSTEETIEVPLTRLSGPEIKDAKRIVLCAVSGDTAELSGDAAEMLANGDAVFVCQPRGFGPTRWTREDPPNYVERSLALLGRTVDTGRLRDIAATARYLRDQAAPETSVVALGDGKLGALAAYAALLEPDIAEVWLIDAALTHMDAGAPQLLSILRTCDIPEAMGLLAPRPLVVSTRDKDAMRKTAEFYRVAGASDALRVITP